MTAIGRRAFYDCKNLETVNIPSSVKRIGAEAFARCDALANISIPESATIGANAFDCGANWTAFYKNVHGKGSSAGSGGAVPGAAGESTIKSMTVSGDTSIDSFQFADGRAHDMSIRIVNTADSPIRLSLPSGYDYETIDETDPLEIPAASTSIITLKRTGDTAFLLSRRQVRKVK